MKNISESCELTKQLLREWQLPEELIEATELLENNQQSVTPYSRRIGLVGKQILDSFSHTQQIGSTLSDKLTIDAALIALAYHYIKLQQPLQEQSYYKTVVHTTRENVFPLVKKLGMWDFKREMEDALFRLAAQEQYEEVKNWLFRFQKLCYESWNMHLSTIQSRCQKVVEGCKVKVVYCSVEGARRRLVRLGGYEHAKMQNFARIYLIVPRIVDCYLALAAVHSIGLPEPYSFQDMIATPHFNGYSGLLTSVYINNDHTKEVQHRQVFDILILTHFMEQVAHRGIIYPPCYQAILNNTPIVDLVGEKQCIQPLVQSLAGEQNDKETTITVFTARNEAKDLKTGSTVLDLAYLLHSELGDHAESATINDKWVPLSTRLENGNRVRIHASNHQGIRSESDLRYVFETKTKRAIVSFLNKEPVRKGRHLLTTYLRTHDVNIDDEALDSEITAVCQKLGMNDPNELYRAIAEKEMVPGLPDHPFATSGLVGGLIIQRRKSAIPKVSILTSTSPTNDWVPLLDEAEYSEASSFRLCGICRPNPLNQIVGVQTKKLLAVHTIDCHKVRGKKFSNLQWQRNIRTVKCILSLQASDRPLLVQNITEVVYRYDSGLAKIHAEVLEHGNAQVELIIFVKNAVVMVELMMDLANIRSVGKVYLEDASVPPDVKTRIQIGPIDRRLISEMHREGLGKSQTMRLTPMINAAQRYGDIIIGYNDQKPTFSKDIFFGRQNEVNRLKSLVGNVGGIALVTGPKRVGKTSLCLRFLDGLAESLQPYLVRVDLRGHYRSSSATVLEDISDVLISKLHLPISPCGDIGGLINVIEHAVDTLGSKKIVLVLDELGGPLQSFANGLLGRGFFEFINSVLDRDLPLSILLVTPPAGLSIMERYDIWGILRSMPSIHLGALELEDAKEMITRPFSQYGVTFRPKALKKVLFLSGQYPYYIILLLKEILAILNSQQSKISVTEMDIELATKKLLRMDSVFSYLLREASRTTLALNCLHTLSTFKAVPDAAMEYPTEKFIPYIMDEKLFSLLKQSEDFSQLSTQSALDQLVVDKIIDKQIQAKGTGYKFSIPLFHHWLQKRDIKESREFGC